MRSRLKPTYEELKPGMPTPFGTPKDSLKPTYEELKLALFIIPVSVFAFEAYL